MNIAVVGTGYVGLVTGTCFAALGNSVTCVDVDAAKVGQLQKGIVPIYEPGLEEVFGRAVKDGNLHFTTELTKAVKGAEVIFLALPTPPGEDGSADLSYVLGVAEAIGPLLKQYTVVVDKSTVPVGTAAKVRELIAQGTSTPFDVVSNPEFLREGLALQDFMEPDRIVVGTSSLRARKVMAELYGPLTRGEEHRLLLMDEASAELTKYAANSFLAMKISYMNEIANLCERLGADVDSVRLGIGSDHRIGPHFLFPGIGYGGSCFPKDIQALAYSAHAHKYDFRLLTAVLEVNARQMDRLQAKVLAYFGGSVRGKTLALWGLAFKPHTDDIRQAPALNIIADLTAKGARIQAYDPEAMDRVRSTLGKTQSVQLAANEYAALKGADALLIATEWPQFRAASLEKIKRTLSRPVVFDGRNIFDLDDMQAHGFYYESIGREIIGGAADSQSA